MFDILHNTQETRYPLQAAFRSANRTREIVGQMKLKKYMGEKLRFAYNSFIRLLDIDFQSLFKCKHCGDNPHTMIMDGIVMGCPKDKMPIMPVLPPLGNLPLIRECNLSDRVYITDNNTRKLLSAYACLSIRKYIIPPQIMICSLYETLCNSLSAIPSLQQVVKEAGNPCPILHIWLQKLVGELSRASPTCGFIQLTDFTSNAYLILKEIAQGDFTNLNNHMDVLYAACPLLIDFITTTAINQDYISDLISSLLDNMSAPFTKSSLPRTSYYGDILEYHNLLEYFPNNPQIKARANYDADKKKNHKGKRLQERLQTTQNVIAWIVYHVLLSWVKYRISAHGQR